MQENLQRKCCACGDVMLPIQRETEAWNGPGSESCLRYQCNHCDANIVIEDCSSIASAIFSGIGTLIVLAYAFMNDISGFITYALFTEKTLFSIALGIGTGALIMVFLLGSILLLMNAFQKMRLRCQHPLLIKGSANSHIWKVLIIGFLPWLLTIGIGYLNYTFLDDNVAVLLVAFPVILAPLYFAPKFGVSWTSAFMAIAFWAVLGGGAIWAFG